MDLSNCSVDQVQFEEMDVMVGHDFFILSLVCTDLFRQPGWEGSAHPLSSRSSLSNDDYNCLSSLGKLLLLVFGSPHVFRLECKGELFNTLILFMQWNFKSELSAAIIPGPDRRLSNAAS